MIADEPYLPDRDVCVMQRPGRWPARTDLLKDNDTLAAGDDDDVRELIQFLNRETKYTDIGVEELNLELREDRVIVSILDDVADCEIQPLGRLLQEFEGLVRANE